jgi:hypothetical protein
VRSGRKLLCVIVIVISLYLSCSPEEKVHMQSQHETVVNLLQLPPEKFFLFDDATEEQLVDALMTMDGFEGTSIGAPRGVDLDRESSLPVLWVRRSSGMRNWQVQVMRNSTLTVADLFTGRVMFYDAFTGPKRINLSQVPRSMVGEPPGRDEAGGITVSVEMLNLRTIANTPWMPSRLALTLILHDWVTNTVVVELTRREQGADIQEAKTPLLAHDLAVQIDEQYRQSRGSSKPAPGALSTEKTLRLEQEGLTLVVPNEMSISDPTWPVDGRAKLSLPAGAIVEASLIEENLANTDATSPATRREIPRGVVCLSILLKALDDTRPKSHNYYVPIHAAKPLHSGDVVDFPFSIDLKRDLGSKVSVGLYQLYLFAGRHADGPYPMRIRER